MTPSTRNEVLGAVATAGIPAKYVVEVVAVILVICIATNLISIWSGANV